jgi:CheY-like chemotaxis protein
VVSGHTDLADKVAALDAGADDYLTKPFLMHRPPGWLRRALINGIGALLTTLAGLVLLTTKFVEGAWVVVVAVPLLMLLFARVQRYYTAVGAELGLGQIPPPPRRTTASLVIVPIGEVSKLTQHALTAALALGDQVVAVAVHADPDRAQSLRETWDRWNPGVRLDIIDSPHRSLVEPVVEYVQHAAAGGRQIAVLIPEVEPKHRRYEILQNQRGILLATVLRARTDVVVCMLPYRLKL